MPTLTRTRAVLGVTVLGAAMASTQTILPLVFVVAGLGLAVVLPGRGMARAAAAVVLLGSAGVLATGLAAWVLPLGIFSLLALAGTLVGLAIAFSCPQRVLDLGARVRGDAAVIISAVAFPTVLATAAQLRGAGYSWALRSDATVQLVVARSAIAQGGVDPTAGQPDPFVSIVLSAAMSAGRPDGPDGLLAHDGSAQAVVTFGVVVLLGLLTSAWIVMQVDRQRPMLRCAAAAGGSILVWGWMVTGFAVPYGFVNSVFALVIAIACWLVWVTAAERPRESAGLLVLGVSVMLGTWPVMAVVPAGLLAVLVVLRWPEIAPASQSVRRRLQVGGAVAACVVGFVAFPRLWPSASIGERLPDGAFAAFTPYGAAGIAMIALAVAALAMRSIDAGVEALGVVALVVSGGIGVAWLSAQRIAADGFWWDYYPRKLAWMVVVLALIVTAGVMMRVVTRAAVTARDRALGPWLVVAIVGIMMFALPPTASVFQGEGYLGIARLIPALTLTSQPGMPDESYRAYDPTQDAAELIAADDGLVVLSNAFESNVSEGWANDVELTTHSPGLSEPLRRFTGLPELTTPEGVCDVARIWAGPMVVLTRDADLPGVVGEQCPHADVSYGSLP